MLPDFPFTLRSNPYTTGKQLLDVRDPIHFPPENLNKDGGESRQISREHEKNLVS